MQLHCRYLSLMSLFSMRYDKKAFPLWCLPDWPSFCCGSTLMSRISPVDVPAITPLKWSLPTPLVVDIAKGGHSNVWMSGIYNCMSASNVVLPLYLRR